MIANGIFFINVSGRFCEDQPEADSFANQGARQNFESGCAKFKTGCAGTMDYNY